MSLTSEVVWRDHVLHGNLVVNFSLCISSVSGKNSWSCLIHNFQQLSQFGLLSLSTIIVLVALFQSMHVQYFCQKCLLAIFFLNQDSYLPPKVWPKGLGEGYTFFPFCKKIHTKIKNHWISPKFLEALYFALGLFFIVTVLGFTFLKLHLSNMRLAGNTLWM